MRPNVQLIFDVWALAMALVKAIQHSRAGQIQTRLVFVLHRDGILYYIAIIGLWTVSLRRRIHR